MRQNDYNNMIQLLLRKCRKSPIIPTVPKPERNTTRYIIIIIICFYFRAMWSRTMSVRPFVIDIKYYFIVPENGRVLSLFGRYIGYTFKIFIGHAAAWRILLFSIYTITGGLLFYRFYITPAEQ